MKPFINYLGRKQEGSLSAMHLPNRPPAGFDPSLGYSEVLPSGTDGKMLEDALWLPDAISIVRGR